MTYLPKLNLIQTERAIKEIKTVFEEKLARALNLTRVSAPMFVKENSGLNDNLNGIERPVRFEVKATGEEVEVVHSLAKWKRYALNKYDLPVHSGLYCDMNAIRRDEDLDALHSIYVDQWDWEKIIVDEDRTLDFLQETVRTIYGVLKETESILRTQYPVLESYLPNEITFLSSQELEDKYPALSPKERERACTKEYGAIFLMQIGGKLRSGNKHDGRAPDYDDWALNGDVLIYYPPLDCSFELSSMGIRVNKESLIAQLQAEDCMERLRFPFHRSLVNGELPLTMGGGIGQSRLCMLLLNKVHIGEVQVSVWNEETERKCKEENIPLM